ncbi:hypothetical protein Pmani_011530 [Petrolisthes manimaculis]|uniref:Uncharacterized protein n=1 Tax=Petrolisthes manimaculis TaxID=1843537 RepID=A0AAE1PZV2_9EUCA|nr:hypothetical protein Pmani_011530 [Petrolisthes manimaculis]
MQCAIVFFILSIGFVPAALAVIPSEAHFRSTIRFEPPANHLEISSSKLYEEGGLANYRFEIMLLEGEAVSMRCPHIYLSEPHEQQLAIYNMETQAMMHSTANDNMNEDESLLFYENVIIDLIASSQPYKDQLSPAAEALYVECSLTRFNPNRKHYALRLGQIQIMSTNAPQKPTLSSNPNGTASVSRTEVPHEATRFKPNRKRYALKLGGQFQIMSTNAPPKPTLSSNPNETASVSRTEVPHEATRFKPNRKRYALKLGGQFQIMSTNAPPKPTLSSNPNGTASVSRTKIPNEVTTALYVTYH